MNPSNTGHGRQNPSVNSKKKPDSEDKEEDEEEEEELYPPSTLFLDHITLNG
jgi:hypothetical protein